MLASVFEAAERCEQKLLVSRSSWGEKPNGQTKTTVEPPTPASTAATMAPKTATGGHFGGSDDDDEEYLATAAAAAAVSRHRSSSSGGNNNNKNHRAEGRQQQQQHHQLVRDAQSLLLQLDGWLQDGADVVLGSRSGRADVVTRCVRSRPELGVAELASQLATLSAAFDAAHELAKLQRHLADICSFGRRQWRTHK
jgi:hypothetical protein